MTQPETDAPGKAGGKRALWGGVLIGIGLGLLILTVIGKTPGARPNGGELIPGVDIGSEAPDFSADDVNGQLIRLSEFRGTPVVINFWATWCGPCRVEMPYLQARAERYNADLAILAVDIDEPLADVQAFAEEFGLTFEILLDPGGEISALYEIRGYPTTIFVDRAGLIKAIHIGGMSEGQLDGYLAGLGLE